MAFFRPLRGIEPLPKDPQSFILPLYYKGHKVNDDFHSINLALIIRLIINFRFSMFMKNGIRWITAMAATSTLVWILVNYLIPWK